MKETTNRIGYTMWARATIDSKVFYSKPHAWFKIWFFLVNRVNFKDHREWKKGECFTTYAEIMEATKTTKDQVKHCIEWLKDEEMLATRKATRGFHIRVIKYRYYQDPHSYKATDNATEKPHRSHTKGEEEKEEKEKYSPDGETSPSKEYEEVKLDDNGVPIETQKVSQGKADPTPKRIYGYFVEQAKKELPDVKITQTYPQASRVIKQALAVSSEEELKDVIQLWFEEPPQDRGEHDLARITQALSGYNVSKYQTTYGK